MKTTIIDNSDFLDYKKYLQSPRWKQLRAEARKRDSNSCRVCDSMKSLHVHHRCYYRINTDNEIHDLVTLCERCHRMFHLQNKVFTNGWEKNYDLKFNDMKLPHKELKTFIQEEIDKVIYDFSKLLTDK